MRALLFALLATTPAVAQTLDDLWLTVSPGLLLAEDAGTNDEFTFGLAAQAARGGWKVRLGAMESAGYLIDFGSPALARTEGAHAVTAEDAQWYSYQTFSLAAGPRAQTGPLMLSILAGPAWTTDPQGEQSALGVVGVGQAYLQLGGGAVWLGGELTGVVNSGASHLGAGAGLRIDLRRAAR